MTLTPSDKKMITHTQKCKRIVESCGGHWHELNYKHRPGDDNYGTCKCGYCAKNTDTMDNPTFTNVADLILMIEKHPLFDDFYRNEFGAVWRANDRYYYPSSYITTPDKLLNEFYDWLERKEG